MRSALTFILAATVLSLGGCAAPNIVAVRMDGQPIRGNPVLSQSLDTDRTICQGEMQKANLSGVTVSGGGFAGLAAEIERSQNANTVFKGCMAQRGYALVPEEQAGRKLQDFQATAAISQQSPTPAPSKR